MVARESLLHTLEEEQIDVVDDLEVAREQVLEQTNSPFLQSFRKDGVVCITELFKSLLAIDAS